jgi:ubiquinone/menaquinone biosynthesis C-methylase UbiE
MRFMRIVIGVSGLALGVLLGRRLFTNLHHARHGEESAHQTRGLVMNWGWRYDLLLWFITCGRERSFRQKIADLAQVRPGEAVLDVGCGTGSLALVAKERVGVLGRVCGIDPAPEQIVRARHKADRRDLSIDFQVGVIEQLPYPDQSFDVVLSTFMMHHLPDDLKRRGLAEIARVLKPGGRLLVLDATHHAGPWKSSVQDQPTLMKEAGFAQVETGMTTFPALPEKWAEIGLALGRMSKVAEGNPLPL